MYRSPYPAADDIHHRLIQHIRKRIQAQGKIPFSEYMHHALYAPGMGYYCNGLHKLGHGGDFITAPECSSLFGQCLATACLPALPDHGCVLEFGPGSGKLAIDMMRTWALSQRVPKRYYMIEVSAELRQRQQQNLQAAVPEWFDRFTWLDSLPEAPIDGVIIANEVLDAMPVDIIRTDATGHVTQAYVTWHQEHNAFGWYYSTPQVQLRPHIHTDLPPNYTTEVSHHRPAWIKSLSTLVHQGMVLLIDYGYLSHEYHHADRDMGTLRCYHQHRAHADPLILTGLQDITAHVNFTAVGQAAEASGFCVSSFGTQADFLLSHGLLDFAQETQGLNTANQIKQLVFPNQMGTAFKVMVLSPQTQ